MSKYLINTTEVYRFDNEAEATSFIEDSKKAIGNPYILVKYSNEYKERKQKGEVIDSFYKVTLTKNFNDIREPEDQIDVNYILGENNVFNLEQ